jgi:hypothetical protein
MSDLHETSIDWVLRSLHAEGVSCDERLPAQLVGAAEEFDVPVELLITWIHDGWRDKERTVEAWTTWCRKYRGTVDRLEREYGRQVEQLERSTREGISLEQENAG